MNPELKQQVEGEVNKFDLEIERLKNEHQDITKEEYWRALREAMEAHADFLALINPLSCNSPDGRSWSDREQRESLNSDLQSMLSLRQRKIPVTEENVVEHCGISPDVAWFLGSAYKSQAELLTLLADSTSKRMRRIVRILSEHRGEYYGFVPETAELGGMNKYFKVEDLGVPKVLTGTLIVSKEVWPLLVDDQDNDNINACNVEGFSYSKMAFNEGNLLFGLGLTVVAEQSTEAKTEELARHEAVHQVDFLKYNRNGLDLLLTEIIAYRLDAKLDKPKNRKLNQDRFDDFVDEFIDDYADDLDLDKSKSQAIIDLAVKVIIELERRLSFERVTAILLNCESFDELFRVAAKLEK